MRTDLAYDDPRAQTVFEGREFEARIRFLVPVNASDKEIAEGLAWELGGGEIASDHILVDGDFRDVQVIDVRRTGFQRFTEWGPAAADGGRSGRERVERIRDSGSGSQSEDPRSGAEAEGPQSGGEAASPDHRRTTAGASPTPSQDNPNA